MKGNKLTSVFFVVFAPHAFAQAPSAVLTPRVVTPPTIPPLRPKPSPPPTPDVSDNVCGPSGNIRMASTERYYPVVSAWANALSILCPSSSLFVSLESTDSAAAEKLCTTLSKFPAVVSFLGRPLNSGEANTTDGINFQCIAKKATVIAIGKSVIQIPAAVDAVVLAARLGGVGASCMSSLPGGGLTFDQLRWIYSSYTVNQLKNTGWSPNALPNSDNLDTTHLWSELCQAGTNCSSLCPSREIALVGPSPVSSDLVHFLLSKIIADAAHGENIATNRYTVTDELGVVPFVTESSYALGLVGFALFNQSLAYAASIQEVTESSYYAPCKGTLQNRLYPLARNIYMDVAADDELILAQVRYFAKFVFSSEGDLIAAQNSFVPLSDANKVTSYIRLDGASRRLSHRRQLSTVACGPYGPITGTGDPVLYNLAANWASYYTTFCHMTTITTTKSSNDVAAAQICGDASKGPIVDIALMTRNLKASEATLQRNGFTYKCIKDPKKRNVIEVTIATKGVIIQVLRVPNGAALDCIESLGGLTVDQLRWIYSSFTTSQLIATGWDPNAIPNSDGNDDTHLWSELGGSNCRATEILVAGPPAGSNTFALLTNVALSGNNETIALNRPNGYFTGEDPSCPNGYPQGNPDAVIQFVKNNSDAIALLDFTDGTLNFGANSRFLRQESLVTVPLKTGEGEAVYPNTATLAECTYPLCQPVFAYVNEQYFSLAKTSSWLRFGFTPKGDDIVEGAGFNPILTSMKTNFINNRLKENRLICFSETVTVRVQGKGIIPIKDLNIGDMVMDASGEYSEVYSWAHFDPAVVTEFLQIYVSEVDQPLELTSHHMLFVGGKAVPASGVRVGDILGLKTIGVAVVQQVARVVRLGSYAPFTTSGTIAVNTIAASVYVDMQQGSGILTIGGRDTPFTMQFLAHMFQAPHRMLCRINFNVCLLEAHDEHGISTWVAPPLGAAEWLLNQHPFLTMTVLVPTILLGLALYALEAIHLNRVLLFVGVATIFLYRHLSKGRKS